MTQTKAVTCCHTTHSSADDESEAFARAVFGRFLRQATICRDIDDAIEHMHIVNDDSRTFCIRLGGELRIPVSRELIFSLAAKKKELLALCEATLCVSRSKSTTTPSHRTTSTEASVGGGAHVGGRRGIPSTPSGTEGALSTPQPERVLYPPPVALAATGSIHAIGDAVGAVPNLVSVPSAPPVGDSGTVSQRAAATAIPLYEEGTGARAVGLTEADQEFGKMTPKTDPPPAPTKPASAATAMPEARPASYPNPPRPAPGTPSSWGTREEEPKTIFVRKVDVKMDRVDMIRHFQAFGEVSGISMNPARGYAFVDFVTHEGMVRAVSADEHIINNKVLQVEEKKKVNQAPPKQQDFSFAARTEEKELAYTARPRQGSRGASGGELLDALDAMVMPSQSVSTLCGQPGSTAIRGLSTRLDEATSGAREQSNNPRAPVMTPSLVNAASQESVFLAARGGGGPGRPS